MFTMRQWATKELKNFDKYEDNYLELLLSFKNKQKPEKKALQPSKSYVRVKKEEKQK